MKMQRMFFAIGFAVALSPAVASAQPYPRQPRPLSPSQVVAPRTAQSPSPATVQQPAQSAIGFSCKAAVPCYFATVGRSLESGGELNFAVPAGSYSPILGIRVGEHYLVAGAPTNGNRTVCARVQQQGTFCFEKVVRLGPND